MQNPNNNMNNNYNIMNNQNTVREELKITDMKETRINEDLKNYVEDFMKSNANEQLLKIIENQKKNIENSVVELKNEKSKLNDIEGTINKMMKKIKKIKDKSEKSIINTSSQSVKRIAEIQRRIILAKDRYSKPANNRCIQA